MSIVEFPYGTVTGGFYAAGSDSLDEGRAPDLRADTSLEVTFVPSVKRVVDMAHPQFPRVIALGEIKATVNSEGVLCNAETGEPGVTLPASVVEGANPSAWHWTAKFKNRGRKGFEDVDFQLPAGATVDLAAAIPTQVGKDTVRVVDEALATRVEAALEHVMTLERGLKGDKGDPGEPGTPGRDGEPGRDGQVTKDTLRMIVRGMSGPTTKTFPTSDDPLAVALYIKGQEVITSVPGWRGNTFLPGSDNMFRLLRGTRRVTDTDGNELSVPERVVTQKNGMLDWAVAVPDDWPVFGYVWLHPSDRRETLILSTGAETFFPTEIRNIVTSDFDADSSMINVSFEAIFRIVEGNGTQLDPAYPVSGLQVEGNGSDWTTYVTSRSDDELVATVSGRADATESGELDDPESWNNRENYRVFAEYPVLIEA